MTYANYFAIGFGGALGAIARVALAGFLPEAIMGMPVYILSINVIGCGLMGILAEAMALYWAASETMRYFLISGFLGGFTTFSAFALEFALLYQRQLLSSFLYAALSFLLSIAAFFVGLKVVRMVFN